MFVKTLDVIIYPMIILEIKTRVLLLIVHVQNLLNKWVKSVIYLRNFNLELIDKLIMLGKKQLDDAQYNDALNSFEQAILLNQNDPDLWNFKGVTLRSLGRYDEAVECFNRSLKIDPRDKNTSWLNYQNSIAATPK